MKAKIYDKNELFFPKCSDSKKMKERFFTALLWCDENPNLVKYIFRRLPYGIYGYDREFIIRAHCTHAAFKSAKSWNGRRGVDFLTWFKIKLKYEVLDALKLLIRLTDGPSSASLDQLESDDGRNRRKNLQAVAVDGGDGLRRDIRIDLQFVLAEALEGREKIMTEMVLEGWKMRQIGEVYGLSESRISQILGEARDKVLTLIRERKIEL